MNLEHFRARFKKLSDLKELNYFLTSGATKEEISQVENNLGLTFPEQVKLFYENFNGLKVDSPSLKIFPIEKLRFASENRLNFAMINGKHQLFFDTFRLNEANQWNILSEDDFRVTLTMASFWSNKVWAWIERERPIWKEEFEN